MRHSPLFLALAAVLLFATTAAAQPGYGSDNSLRFRVGLFTPDADSVYWDEKFTTFTGDEDDFRDASLGVDFLYGLGSGGVLLSADFYEAVEDQAYREFVDFNGFDILHETRLSVNSLTLGYMFQFARGSRVSPYVGAGGGVYLWELEERGDFIDFFQVDPELFNAVFEDDGEAFGWYWLAGLEFAVSPQWGAFVEARGRDVDDELSGDFDGFGDLDLSGLNVAGGVSFTF